MQQALKITTAENYPAAPLRGTVGVDLWIVLESALDEWRSRFRQNRIILEEHLHPSIGDAACRDPFLLKAALGHLLRNALEATRPHGRVGFYARRNEEDRIEIGIVDSGSGIDPHHLGRILLPLFSTKEGHAGLGLNVASDYLAQYGATLRIESVLGEGTTAEIVLPAYTE
ncbi:MAG TPA: HAMP domain-containing sensor histidine kinase [Candidatus Binatia bacterium]|nr:HAMP domain-containing sensor histidine kinase [Candidatus Binatia bacterium]